MLKSKRLIGVFVLALFLRLFRIGLDGFSNLYYAATVQSIRTSWHNFFFASFDPAGFVSVDKPPLGFWIQALSVSIFGFHGWALVLPQALAGALSALVLYFIVKRVFGVNAGLLAALILAITPISVATQRSNTPDSQLLFVLLLAAWAALKAAESGRLRWLLACAALVGIGFNVKMLQAWLVLPAFFVFLPSPHPLFKHLGQLTLVMLVLLTVSFTWPLAVDLTPATSRPYVGSTSTNHVFELIAVHNGARRLEPILAWFGIRERDSISASPSTPQPASAQTTAVAAQTDSTDESAPDGGATEVGQPGALRLFNPQMAGQVSWLLPLALLSLFACAARFSWKQPLGREPLFFLLWGGWLIPVAFFFSYGGLIHRYYLDMLAPPVAALSAAGLTVWGRGFLERKRAGWTFVIAFALTSATTIFILTYYPEIKWLIWIVVLLSLLTLAILIWWFSSRSSLPRGEVPIALTLITIFLVPFIWSTTPSWRGNEVVFPHAGPDLLQWGGTGNDLSQYQPLAQFLQSRPSSETFILATENAVMAAPLELLTKQPVMAIGGFTGVDPILPKDKISNYINNGQVRFVLLPRGEANPPNASQWVMANCQLVNFSNLPVNQDLYDCKPSGN